MLLPTDPSGWPLVCFFLRQTLSVGLAADIELAIRPVFSVSPYPSLQVYVTKPGVMLETGGLEKVFKYYKSKI
jgi:hypothetical protein